jgi:hypothetical protein
MTILNRILISLVLGLMALGGIEYALLRSAHTRLATEQAKTKNLTAQVRGHKTRAAAVGKATADAEARTKELDHAVQANPDWAATPVPDAVWDSLYGPEGTP